MDMCPPVYDVCELIIPHLIDALNNTSAFLCLVPYLFIYLVMLIFVNLH